MQSLRGQTLEFEPGERFAYSNSGYVLLGCIVEKASGRSYEQFMQEFVLKPLGMKDSGCDHFQTILPHRATGYTPDGDTWVNSAYIDMTGRYAFAENPAIITAVTASGGRLSPSAALGLGC